MSKKKLLAGVRVVDLTRVLAGPYCTMLLGDLGADVLKIEAPGRGDDTRHWGPPFTESGMSAYFISANRNKRSLTLNLKSDRGIEILKGLIKTADVVVDNFKTGTLERMGISYAEMQSLKPDIIYCTITGFGTTGPDADKPGYDFIVQAMGGLMSLTGPIDDRPYRVGVAISDLLTGLYASNAINAALLHRERHGEGQRIDASLLDSQIATLSYVASNYLNSGEAPTRLGNGHPNIVPYQDFKSKDGYFAFASGNDSQWKKFCAAVDKQDWSADDRFATNPQRVKNRTILVPLLEKLFEQKSIAEWLEICEKSGIPAAPINTIDQVFADPQVLARNLIVDGKLTAGDPFKVAGAPYQLNGEGAEIRFPPPALGEHNQEILRSDLGLTEQEIESLQADGVI